MEFSSNTAQSFKVRLPQRLSLEGQCWKVAIYSLQLPFMVLCSKFQDHDVLFDINYQYQSGRTVSAQFKGSDISHLEKHECCTQSTEFLNNLKSTLENKRQAYLPRGESIPDAQYFHWEWQTNGPVPELVLKNSSVKTVRIQADFAIEMEWLYGKDIRYLDHNLRYEAPNESRTSNTGISGGAIHKAENGWLYLSPKYNWHFLNLNANFSKKNKTYARQLLVYSNLTKSAVVGDSFTQVLGEVHYTPDGFFMPQHLSYQELRHKELDIIELQISEDSGQPFNFKKESKSIVTLHFKKVK